METLAGTWLAQCYGIDFHDPVLSLLLCDIVHCCFRCFHLLPVYVPECCVYLYTHMFPEHVLFCFRSLCIPETFFTIQFINVSVLTCCLFLQFLIMDSPFMIFHACVLNTSVDLRWKHHLFFVYNTNCIDFQHLHPASISM